MTQTVDKGAVKSRRSTKSHCKPRPGATTSPKRGRPSIFSDELVDEICLRLALCQSLLEICEDPSMPDRVSVIRWLQRGTLYLAGGKDKYPDYEQFGEFCNKYARARELQLDMLLDECLPIADDGRNDWKFRKSKTGEIVAVPDNEMVNRSRLRVDTRFRMAEKLNPRKYGVSKNINLKEEPPVDWRQKTLERAKQRRFRSLGLPFMEREKAEATTK